jgi:hypothetical protein
LFNIFIRKHSTTLRSWEIISRRVHLEAYCWDQSNNSCPIHERLKEDHFHLTPSSRMSNALAQNVLDKRMLLLMQVRNEDDL